MKQNEDEYLKLILEQTSMYNNIIESLLKDLQNHKNNNDIITEDSDFWESKFQNVSSKIEELNKEVLNYKDNK